MCLLWLFSCDWELVVGECRGCKSIILNLRWLRPHGISENNLWNRITVCLNLVTPPFLQYLSTMPLIVWRLARVIVPIKALYFWINVLLIRHMLWFYFLSCVFNSKCSVLFFRSTSKYLGCYSSWSQVSKVKAFIISLSISIHRNSAFGKRDINWCQMLLLPLVVNK